MMVIYTSQNNNKNKGYYLYYIAAPYHLSIYLSVRAHLTEKLQIHRECVYISTNLYVKFFSFFLFLFSRSECKDFGEQQQQGSDEW